MKTGIILKTLGLLLFLGFVIYGIRSLNSGSLQTEAGNPNSAISALLGSDLRLLNWCPLTTDKVEFLTAEGAVAITKTEAADISALCEIMIGGFQASTLEQAPFSLKLRAHGSRGEITELFTAPNGLFKVQDMPFSSSGLSKVLGRMDQK